MDPFNQMGNVLFEISVTQWLLVPNVTELPKLPALSLLSRMQPIQDSFLVFTCKTCFPEPPIIS